LNTAEVLAYKRDHVRHNFKTEVFPDALAFIKKWRDKKRMALASNSTRNFVENALREAGISDCFEAVCTADEVVHRKPDPEMYNLTLRNMHLSPADSLVFEDSPAGVVAASRADCPVIMVDNGAGRVVEGMTQYTWKELNSF
jgi:HAD superfamily hydrolase (TIGR01509 family)